MFHLHTLMPRVLLVALLSVGLAVGCRGTKDAAPAGEAAPGQAPPAAVEVAPAAAPEETLPPTPSPYDALPEAVRALLDKPFTGDLDEMVKRRLIRAGVVFNRTFYFTDKGVQRGIAYESLRHFEDALNTRLKTGNLRVQVAFLPLTRDMLLPALTQGKVDLVAAMLTVTPERQRVVDFTNPTRTNVSEIVVTGPGAPPIATIDDLSGREVYVRKTSSYFESLTEANRQLQGRGKPPITIVPAPENLEDDDLMEMVNAGLVPATVVDDYLAEFWQKVFTKVTLHPDLALRTGGVLGAAVRKDNPQLKEAANAWIRQYAERTAFGNVLQQRYLESTKYVKSATSEAERRKFLALVELFKKYGGQYDLDYLLMAAQAYQESQLNHQAKSAVGAIGIMQVMPATGRDLGVGDIRQIEPNIHAGVKYIRFMMDQYFKDEPMDRLNKGLMTFAAYNAGPGRIRQLRREAESRGLDPNVWFGNVERVASERIGRETVQYVSNIYKYYVAYRLVSEQMERRDKAKTQIASPR
jgi:membrane-bound lytic murein transglycosylase MltF